MEELEVPMRRAFRFAGTITGADGAPAAGLRVRLETATWPAAVIDAGGETLAQIALVADRGTLHSVR